MRWEMQSESFIQFVQQDTKYSAGMSQSTRVTDNLKYTITEVTILLQTNFLKMWNIFKLQLHFIQKDYSEMKDNY